MKRALDLIIFFSHSFGKKVPGGIEVIFNVESISHYIDMEQEAIEKLLKGLEQQKVLVQTAPHVYLITNEEALRALPEQMIKKAS